MASGFCNEVLLTSTEARIPHRKGLLHRNHQQRMKITTRTGALPQNRKQNQNQEQSITR
ncbi:Hypothetical predicted protein [Pelobates cultripes]|uniref:Uncharacterized protein n=1 Tax=Pelobates cultripes TaxID=61616 RepID=A0AAD1RPR2_PELCU|nr:Hypothetical predicted protein [Pelobates cultripes]